MVVVHGQVHAAAGDAGLGPRRSNVAPAGGDAAAPGGLGDMIRNDTFNNLAALCRRGSLPRNGPERSPPQ